MNTSSPARQFRNCLPLATLLIILLPALAAAQDPVKSFDQLNTRLKIGDTIWVTDAQGQEVKGKLSALSTDGLMLDAGGTKPFAARDVGIVRERRRDSLKNGAIIGAIPGAIFGLFVGGFASETGTGAALGAVVVGALGAAVGVGIDALIPGKKVVAYWAPRSTGPAPSRVSLAPVVTPRAKGVAVAFSF